MKKWLTTKSIARLLALMVGTLGLAVMVGWYLKIPAIIQISHSFVPMQFNTALGFLLCGAGLFAASVGWHRIALVTGVVAGLISLLTLIEYWSGVHLGIDEFFIHHYITTWTPEPGRMAPNTAIGFMLSGIILVLVNCTNLKVV